MTRILIAFITLFLVCQSVSADYYIGFTQVDAQPQLGRLAIHRGIVRSAKYVDWMCEHREELAKEGIFPDADPGGMIEINQSWVIDGQTIEVYISSNHLPERTGPGTALPDNHMRIKIDGVLRYDTVIGKERRWSRFVVSHVEILPADNIVQIRATRTIYDPSYHCHGSNMLYFFYGSEWGKEGEEVLCDEAWLDANIEGEHHEEQPREVPGAVLKPVPVNARAVGE